MRRFAELLDVSESTRILDVGGTPDIWSMLPTRPNVTLLNIKPVEAPGFRLVVADASRLPFSENSFEILFANSVIEHLGTIRRQQEFAVECRRVATNYWVQCPNRYFPIEPHFLAPVIHWLPKSWQRRLLRFTPWGMLTRPSPERARQILGEIRLISPSEMARLFPEARILRERVFGLTKSVVAVKSNPEVGRPGRIPWPS